MHRIDAHERRFPGAQDISKSNGVMGKASSSRDNLPNGRLSNGKVNGSNGIITATSPGYFSGRTSSNGNNEDGALYTVDHLATFTVGESYELVYPQDGIRRLRQMEKSSGIWTQRMYLRLETSWLVIIDFENGDVVERFPLDLVTDTTSFISQDPKDIYNNILLFTVKEDPRQKGATFSEMHIFHCLQTSAQKIADDVRLLTKASGKGGVVMSKRNKDTVIIPPAPNNPPPEPPTTRGNGHVREKIDNFNAFQIDPRRKPAHMANGRSRQEQGLTTNFHAEDDTESQRSESTNYERDVAILNHCFDDIEHFIARLQYASASYKELEHRQRQRKSNKKEPGDGLRILRSRPPAEAKFIDIFQKFKLSFNLLGKLRSHIHDPNAPELIHFLFTPLALVFEASQGAEYGINLASRIIPPLLTAEAKQLLLNCLTSKESELWQSLGDAWTQTRDEWPSYVPAYYPTFQDGWEPNLFYTETDKTSRHNGSTGGRVESWKDERDDEGDSQGYGADYPQYVDHRKPGATPSPSPRQNSERDQQSDFSDVVDSDFDRKQRHFAAKLDNQNAKIVRVSFSRDGKNEKELSVQKGEILQVMNDSRQWWMVKNCNGEIGYVPCTIVIAYQSTDSVEDPYAAYPPSQRQQKPRHNRYE